MRPLLVWLKLSKINSIAIGGIIRLNVFQVFITKLRFMK
jgi:hypothetical protein